jgi:hypothetical protein
MTLIEIENKIRENICQGMEFTSTMLASYLWTEMVFTDKRRPTFHPYAAQITIVLKSFPNVIRDKKTKIYKVIA